MATEFRNIFNYGEISPLLWNRLDAEFFRGACKRLENFIPLKEGGVTKRPGTIYVSTCALGPTDGTVKPTLIPFRTGVASARVIEYGPSADGRMYMRDVNIPTPFAYVDPAPSSQKDIAQIQYVQHENAIYFTTGVGGLRMISLTGSAFSLSSVTTSGIDFSATSPQTYARNPKAIGLFEGRILLGRSEESPSTFWGSKVGAFTVFDISSAASDDLAYEKKIYDRDGGEIVWMIGRDSLIYGTTSGPFLYGSPNEIVSPRSVQLPRRQAQAGCDPAMPAIIDSSVFYIERGRRKIRSFSYLMEAEAYECQDVSALVSHLGEGKFAGMALQTCPETVLWVWTEAGTLLSFTIDRTLGVAAWARHSVGAPVDSVCVIPSEGEDIVYLAVRRKTGKWSIERLAPRYQSTVASFGTQGVNENYRARVTLSTAPGSAYCWIGASTDDLEWIENEPYVRIDGLGEPILGKVRNTQTVETTGPALFHKDGITPIEIEGTPVVTLISVPAPNTGRGVFTDSSIVIESPAVTAWVQVNDASGEKRFTVPSAHTWLMTWSAVLIEGAGDPFYGVVTYSEGSGLCSLWLPDGVTPAPVPTGTYVHLSPVVDQVSGLERFSGKVVEVLVDGELRETITNPPANIPINPPGSYVVIGLPFTSLLEPTQPVADPIKAKRIAEVVVTLRETEQLKAGPDESHLYDVPLSTVGTDDFASGNPIVRIPLDAGWDQDASIVLVSDTPLPCTILSVGSRVDMA